MSGGLADGHGESLAQPAQRPVDRSCLGGVIGVQHAPHFAFGDIEIKPLVRHDVHGAVAVEIEGMSGLDTSAPSVLTL